jgi:hypothetical protein
VRERLRHLFDLIDPMPDVIATPVGLAWERLAVMPEPAGTRNHVSPTLCFKKDSVTVQVEIGAVLTGMVVPATAEVTVRWPDGVIRVPVDERGLFEVDGVPPGPVRLEIGHAVTDWFVR